MAKQPEWTQVTADGPQWASNDKHTARMAQAASTSYLGAWAALGQLKQRQQHSLQHGPKLFGWAHWTQVGLGTGRVGSSG